MVWQPGYILDMMTPVRHVASMMEGALEPPTITDLALAYTHPNPADLDRVKRNEGIETDWEAKCFLMKKAIGDLGKGVESLGGDHYRLTMEFNKLRYGRKKIHREIASDRPDPFDPMVGNLAKNIRAPNSKDDLAELRKSMQDRGWIKGSKVIVDERGVILSGHRRKAVAEELGIEPEYEKVNFSKLGEHGIATRFAIAVGNNEGSKPLTTADRKYIVAELDKLGWTQQEMADLLKVSQATVSNDIKRLSGVITSVNDGQSSRTRRVVTPEQEEQIINEIKTFGGEKGRRQLAAELGISEGAIENVVAHERGVRQGQQQRIKAEVPKEPEPPIFKEPEPEPPAMCICSACGNQHIRQA
jgi:ParB-like chromosome segregation protein Spo0J